MNVRFLYSWVRRVSRTNEPEMRIRATHLQKIFPYQVAHVVDVRAEGITRCIWVLVKLRNRPVATDDRHFERIVVTWRVSSRQAEIRPIVPDRTRGPCVRTNPTLEVSCLLACSRMEHIWQDRRCIHHDVQGHTIPTPNQFSSTPITDVTANLWATWCRCMNWRPWRYP